MPFQLSDKVRINLFQHLLNLAGTSVKSLLVIFLALLNSLDVAADVFYRPPTYSTGTQIPPTIVVSGTIQPDNLQAFKRAVAEAWNDSKTQTIRAKTSSNYPMLTIELNSSGGNLDTALKIGEIARSIEANAVIQHADICASSCVFILAGAVTRYVTGKVGIHRPIDPNDDVSTPKKQREKYEALGKHVKNYLSLTNIPNSLFDRMVRIPPEKVRWLTEGELAEFGLSENDPYYDEARNARMAKADGTSKQQLVLREITMQSICDGAPDFPKCVGDLLKRIK